MGIARRISVIGFTVLRVRQMISIVFPRFETRNVSGSRRTPHEWHSWNNNNNNKNTRPRPAVHIVRYTGIMNRYSVERGFWPAGRDAFTDVLSVYYTRTSESRARAINSRQRCPQRGTRIDRRRWRAAYERINQYTTRARREKPPDGETARKDFRPGDGDNDCGRDACVRVPDRSRAERFIAGRVRFRGKRALRVPSSGSRALVPPAMSSARERPSCRPQASKVGVTRAMASTSRGNAPRATGTSRVRAVDRLSVSVLLCTVGPQRKRAKQTVLRFVLSAR